MEQTGDGNISDELQCLSFDSTAATTTNRSSSSASSTAISPADLRFLRRLGSGDIGSVYLAQMLDNSSSSESQLIFAAKVMDKKELASRNKERRARTEREILEMLDHPFFPKLHAVVESPDWFCLLTEFCSGGDLHVLRQRQPFKRFPESAVRFYASEIVVALKYLHMMGIIYRDLKPENVLVRSDGHIMLTDFNLSLRCQDSTSPPPTPDKKPDPARPGPHSTESEDSTQCILPNCIIPTISCFNPNTKRRHRSSRHNTKHIIAESVVGIRSASFVGTHEYLAPEIVSGEGHGGAVDWWTLGVLMFELFYGFTPFRGASDEANKTLANIVASALEFPKEPVVSASAKDLMSLLLTKDPSRRLGSSTGALAVREHAFFRGVNWALLRCACPPFVPSPFCADDVVCDDDDDERSCRDNAVDYY